MAAKKTAMKKPKNGQTHVSVHPYIAVADARLVADEATKTLVNAIRDKVGTDRQIAEDLETAMMDLIEMAGIRV